MNTRQFLEAAAHQRRMEAIDREHSRVMTELTCKAAAVVLAVRHGRMDPPPVGSAETPLYDALKGGFDAPGR